MKFFHLSDLHFHRNTKDNIEVTKMLENILKHCPDHKLIITGDIVDDGHTEQFHRAYEALEPFKGRVYISPGNHDFGAAGNFYSRERAERFDEMLSIPLEQGGTFTGDNTPVINVVKEKNDQVMLIALDSNLETQHFFDFACGEIGDNQLEPLNNILSNPATSGMIKILFFHHHPFIHNNPFMELKDGRELFRVIFAKVHAVLFGHKHVAGLWENTNSIPYIVASENSPGKKNRVREINIAQSKITVKDVTIH